MNIRRSIATLAAVGIAATGLVACGGGTDENTVRLGTTDAADKAFNVLEDKAEEAGIDLEIVAFSDYNSVNDALAQGQIDINKFQHILFLSDYNVKAGQDLVALGSTEVYPLALFWKGHDSLDGIEGEEIAIPNDTTNQGRAIKVLAAAGLLTLKDDSIVIPGPVDIDEGASKVKVVPVDAAQSPAAYNEGRPAVINNTYLERAGIQPSDAVFQDDPNGADAEPFINIMAVRAEDAADPQLNKLVELWHSPEVRAAVQEDSRGTAVAVTRSADELAKILQRLQDSLK